MITVKEIVEKFLKDNGYDGLCGCNRCCELGDLFPCQRLGIENCEAGYKHYFDPPDDDKWFIEPDI